MSGQLDVEGAARILLEFLDGGGLTTTIARLEHALDGADARAAAVAASDAKIDVELLVASMVVRGELGRMSDLIHASAITLALPYLLEPGERVKGRPSLAAGNDPSQLFDLETDRRIAEFKLSKWAAGSNAMRKRQTFKDLVGLALDQTGRRPELYVLGSQPAQFLRTSKSTPAWALNRSPETLREKFASRFGSLDVPIAEFTAKHASHVAVIDLAEKLPQIFMPVQQAPVIPEGSESALE